MSKKNTVFYQGNTAIVANFSAEAVSTDGAVILLEKLEREHNLLSGFSRLIPDRRHPLRTIHEVDKMVKRRIFMLMQGYEDTNDVEHLKHDPVFDDILDGHLASQPTLSRFENRIDRRTIYELCES